MQSSLRLRSLYVKDIADYVAPAPAPQLRLLQNLLWTHRFPLMQKRYRELYASVISKVFGSVNPAADLFAVPTTSTIGKLS